MAHTPGPWRVDPKANCDVQSADGAFEIASTHPGILRGGVTPDGDFPIYNARLIASAPELLAALEALIKCADEQAEQLASEFGAGPEEAALTEARRIVRVATGAA